MNQMKTRLQSLGLVDRALRATTDDELTAAVDGLDDDHRESLERVVDGEATPDAIRQAAAKGRINGTLEGIALVLTEAALNDCIEKLGDDSDNPTSDQLREVLPGLIERHGLAITRVMLASTVAGEAAAADIIRDLLKYDDVVKLPREEPRPVTPAVEREPSDTADDPEREAIKAKRLEARRRKSEESAQRRLQSARDRGRL